jgi:pheromone shutdown protein TraB
LRQITLKRTWSKMPLWYKTKLVYTLLFQAVFLPSSDDLNNMVHVMIFSDKREFIIFVQSSCVYTLTWNCFASSDEGDG